MKDTTGQVATPPHGVVQKYGLPYGKASAPVKVTAYEDFMCPVCGDFETGSRDMIRQYVDQGKVQVQYRMISFLDRSSSTKYSTRAENAAAVVLDTSGAGVAKKFHDLLYENQPQEGSAGLSDSQLTDYAVQAGAKRGDVSGAIKSLRFEQWVKNATEASSKKGVTGTPTVFVDGKELKFGSVSELPGMLRSAIENKLASP
jgi:protein-disulfide isomerase